jgi:hypothetical protein
MTSPPHSRPGAMPGDPWPQAGWRWYACLGHRRRKRCGRRTRPGSSAPLGHPGMQAPGPRTSSRGPDLSSGTNVTARVGAQPWLKRQGKAKRRATLRPSGAPSESRRSGENENGESRDEVIGHAPCRAAAEPSQSERIIMADTSAEEAGRERSNFWPFLIRRGKAGGHTLQRTVVRGPSDLRLDAPLVRARRAEETGSLRAAGPAGRSGGLSVPVPVPDGRI